MNTRITKAISNRLERHEYPLTMASTCQPMNDNNFGPVVHGCRSDFDFTLLFEQSVLAIGPAALLLLFAPPRFVKLWKSSKKTISTRVLSIKAFVCLVLIGTQLALLILWSSHHLTKATIPSAALSFLAAITILFLSRLEDSRSIHPSPLLNVYLLVSLALDTVQARTLFLRKDNPAILGLFTANIGVKVVLLLLESRSKRGYLRPPYNGYSPESMSGFFSKSFFWWLSPILATGFRRVLTLDDLFKPDESMLSGVLCTKIQVSWNNYCLSGKYALLKASLHCIRWSLAAIIFPRICLIGFSYAQPFLISAAVEYVAQPEASQNKNDGYGLIAAAGLIYIGIALSTTHYQHHMYRSVTSFRGGMVSLIYQRTLEVQAGIYDESKALTLMSTDIDRLIMSLTAVCEIWARVIEMAIGVWLLERQLGWVCVAPIIVVIITMYFAGKVAAKIAPRQKEWVKAIQRRVGMTASMLGNMKSVKMMGIGEILYGTIQSQRVRELDLSKRFRVMMMWRMLLSFVPGIVGPLACFVIFAIQASREGESGLSASKAFSSLAIISLLTSPAEEFLLSLPSIAMSAGCLERIQSFLLSDSVAKNVIATYLSPDEISSITQLNDTIELQEMHGKSLEGPIILLKKASIAPAPSASTILHDINLQATKGSLTMVIGIVGCGKSTLLKAIIGELACTEGSININARDMAYCSQSAWLQNASVKSIVCGPIDESEIDERWYALVMHSCAFDDDVLSLPDQHDTIIGSRGVTLSGGQKQRLALARAVYARRELVVLDDILSALDSRTEKLVVDRLLGKAGLFRTQRSTVILTTHSIRHLPLADNIIVLGTDGAIAEQGSFERLRFQDGFVSRLLVHPELLEAKSSPKAGDSKTSILSQSPAPKALKGPSASDAADLTRQIGDTSVYIYYFKSIGWKISMINVVSSFMFALGSKFPSLWLNFYVSGTVSSLPLFAVIYALSGVVALSAAGMVLYSLYMWMTPKSGAGLHKILLRSVMNAPQRFFDDTDTGTTLNRFSQDMTLIDGTLPGSAVIFQSSVWGCIAQFGLIAIGSSYMALLCPGLIIAVYFLQKYYLRTSRQVRFLDLEYKSPLYTHFTETVEGLSTIRAFGWQEPFVQKNLERLDISQRPFYLLFCIQRWLNLILLLLVSAMAVSVVALATNLQSTTSASRIGVSLSAVVTFNQNLAMLMQFWTQMETSLGAVARVKGFEEGTANENKEDETLVPGEDWPTRGAIEFKNVSASYGDAPALKDVSFTVNPGEKIGICGRTGSGKSTLLSVLLRILDMASGTILIDGLDLRFLPRSIIRSRLITIPQEPFILAGTVRYNLDPSTLVADDQIVTALEKVGLWDLLGSRGGLDTLMLDNPLSQGQQQIFCLARAILRLGEGDEKGRGEIMVLDEATSNVDSETDALMQKLIREEFKECTILTVAHRLDTIADSDRIAVLDGGQLAEFESPEVLMGRESLFRELRGRH